MAAYTSDDYEWDWSILTFKLNLERRRDDPFHQVVCGVEDMQVFKIVNRYRSCGLAKSLIFVDAELQRLFGVVSLWPMDCYPFSDELGKRLYMHLVERGDLSYLRPIHMLVRTADGPAGNAPHDKFPGGMPFSEVQPSETESIGESSFDSDSGCSPLTTLGSHMLLYSNPRSNVTAEYPAPSKALQHLPFPAPSHSAEESDQARMLPVSSAGAAIWPESPLFNLQDAVGFRPKAHAEVHQSLNPVGEGLGNMNPLSNHGKLARVCVMLTIKLVMSLRHLIPLVKATEGKEDKEEDNNKKGKIKKKKAEKNGGKSKGSMDVEDEEDVKRKDAEGGIKDEGGKNKKGDSGAQNKGGKAGDEKEKADMGTKDKDGENSAKRKILDPTVEILRAFFHEFLDQRVANAMYLIGTNLTNHSREDSPLKDTAKCLDEYVEELGDNALKVGELITEWTSEAQKAKEKGDELKLIKKETSTGFYDAKLMRRYLLGAVSALGAPLAVMSVLATNAPIKDKLILAACGAAFTLIAASVGIFLFRRSIVMKIAAKKISKKADKHNAKADLYAAGIECLNDFHEVQEVFKQRLITIKTRMEACIQSPGDVSEEEGLIARCQQVLFAISQVSQEMSTVPEVRLPYADQITLTFIRALSRRQLKIC
eukprot:TRINITY_DN7273_c0_g1_i2.p1 TRINITY_DN7273_c0_g1~~TRINITY_DN7273_c0_g1_i2.p1  ORF type:complete len:723 (+),score=145.80 TRINITY_DN7273_c0_g1_i2:219-2171(+)